MANFRSVRRTPIAVRGSRRQTRWFEFAPAELVFAPTTAALFFTLDADELSTRPFTVVRTHLEYYVRSDQAAANEEQALAIGMAVVSDQAVAVGITAIPTPITDLNSDLWFLLKVALGSGSGVNDGQVGFGGSVDSKAMRKVEEGSDVIIVAEAGGAAVTEGFVLAIGGRMLVKLH